MEDGGSPTEDQAAAIQRLIAKSVPEMALEDVAVFDGNGNDVSTDGQSAKDGSDAEEIAQVVEDQIDKKVMKVLGPIYGEDNVKVSARAKINMEKLIRESTSYTTPEKIDEQDKTGIVSKEETYNESSVTQGSTQGVAGTDANADTPQYNTDGTTGGSESASESASREYLVDQIKEQGQVDPGVLDDLTVSVAINGNGYGSLREAQIRSLVGNAAGIAAADQNEKITIASAPFYKDNTNNQNADQTSADTTGVPLYAVIAGVAAALLLIILAVILIIRRKRRKAEELEEETEILEEETDSLLDLNQELQEIQNDRGMELKKNIREFADQNAEISAQLLKSWLNGGGANGE